MQAKHLIILFVVLNFAIRAMSQDDFQVIFDEEPAPVIPAKTGSLENLDTMRLRIVEKAHAYIGVSYRYGQSDKSGFDCSGYVRFVFADFGFDLPHSSYEQYIKSRHIKAGKAKPGDLVFFVTSGKSISHVGIYLGDDLFIHSPSSGKAVKIDSLESAYYKMHLAGYGTFL